VPGKAKVVGVSASAERAVEAVLREARRPLRVEDVAVATGLSSRTVVNVVARLERSGVNVERSGSGHHGDGRGRPTVSYKITRRRTQDERKGTSGLS